jgi:hypothetical protein
MGRTQTPHLYPINSRGAVRQGIYPPVRSQGYGGKSRGTKPDAQIGDCGPSPSNQCVVQQKGGGFGLRPSCFTEDVISSPPAPPPQLWSTTPGGNVGPIVGVIDGINPFFSVGAVLKQARVQRNGIYLTFGADYVFASRTVKFLAGAIPQPGDVVTILGWVL